MSSSRHSRLERVVLQPHNSEVAEATYVTGAVLVLGGFALCSTMAKMLGLTIIGARFLYDWKVEQQRTNEHVRAQHLRRRHRRPIRKPRS